LIDERQNSNTFKVQFLEDLTVYNLVAVKSRQRLSVSKRAALKYDMETFNFKKLNDWGVKEQYQVKILNRFAALENLDDEGGGGDDDDDEVDEGVSRSFRTES
jgi:hypothetical protein